MNQKDTHRKLIDIPKSDKIWEELQLLAIRAGKDPKNYIQALIVNHVKDKRE